MNMGTQQTGGTNGRRTGVPGLRLGGRSGGHMVDLLFTLALFCVFAASALMVVLIGANVYKNTVEGMDAGFAGRTSLTYVATKIRQNDTAGAVHLESLGDARALVLDQEVAGERYQTWIYFHDGYLRETFTMAGNAFEPENGQTILEVADFSMEQEGALLRLTATDGAGNVSTRLVAPRSGLD